MKKSSGSYPRVRVEGGGRGVVAQAGSVLLVTVRKSALDTAISAALTSWRKPRAVHDPGKILLDVSACGAIASSTRSGLARFGPMHSV